MFKLVLRAVRLRCPVCGSGRLYHGLKMHECCSDCDARFEREPGFFLGAIYFNYGLTALISVVFYAVAVFGGFLSANQAMLATLPFVILFPIWYSRYARSFWLAFDQLFDPR